ncbi:MAG TPA: hypothetical protein ENG78_00460 [Acidiferrobacteraceae bacterium]|nr:hypothetical protein [Acidiferrobacteraceae bacterium]HEX19289.1 hypothetical protein [Acidiferrobacteraceae bacterium]
MVCGRKFLSLFLGECDDQAVRCYLQVVKGIASKSFSILFDRIIFRKKQSILWASVSSVPLELEMLNLHLQAAITGCGYKPEERKFIPHVTVACKIKQSPIIGEWRPVEWNIDRLVLMRSQADVHGVRYMSLGAWSLG